MKRLRLLDRYIGAEFLKAYTMALLGLVALLFLFNAMDLFRMETEEPRYLMGLYLLYRIPSFIDFLVPAALILAVTFSVAQLTVNRELVAIYSAGVSFYRATVTILLFGVFLSIFLFFFKNFIVTPANALAERTMARLQKEKSFTKDLVWQKNIRGSHGYYFIYYLDRDHGEIVGGFHYLQVNAGNHPERLLQAKSAKYDAANGSWILSNVDELLLNQDMQIVSRTHHDQLTEVFPEDMEFFAHPSRDPSELDVIDLLHEISSRIARGFSAVPFQVELQMRFAFPLMNIILALVGTIAGASGKLRSTGPLVRSLLISIIVFFVYFLTFHFGLSLGNNGVLPPVVAGWGPTLIYFALAIVLVIRFKR